MFNIAFLLFLLSRFAPARNKNSPLKKNFKSQFLLLEMKIINGDLVKLAKENRFDFIVHGCNCQATMRAGIAKQIAQHFPTAKIADDMCAEKHQNTQLGMISHNLYWREKGETNKLKGCVVINAYTQKFYGRNGKYVDYDAVTRAFACIKKEFGGRGYRFGIPQIGAGLGGGDWEGEIRPRIEKEMEGEDLTLVLYKPLK